MKYISLQQSENNENDKEKSKIELLRLSDIQDSSSLNVNRSPLFLHETSSFDNDLDHSNKPLKVTLGNTCSLMTIQNYDPSSLYWQRATLFFAMFFGIGSAVRQWAGTAGFFESWISTSYSPIVGGLAAIAPCAFYYENNKLIFNRLNHYFENKINKESYEINLPHLEDIGLTQANPSRSIIAQILFGTGHAAAVFGIVFNSFPTQLNWPGLKETILLCLVISNFCFGTDKAKKIVDDMVDVLGIITCKKLNITLYESEYIFELLQHYENMLSKSAFTQTSDQRRENLKQILKVNTSFSEIILSILSHICDMQKELDVIKKNEARALSLEPVDNENVLSAHELPIDFSLRLHATQWPGKIGEWVTAVIANAIVLSNAVYNVAGAEGISKGFGLPLFVAYILCVIGLFSSLGLNRLYAGRLRDNFLTYCRVGEVVVFSPPRNGLLRMIQSVKSISPFDCAGYFLAILQALSGIYFAKEALKICTFLDYLGDIGKSIIEIFCMGSVGLMLTITKVDPTTDFLKTCWHKMRQLLRCERKEVAYANTQEVRCLEASINRTLYLIKLLFDDRPGFFLLSFSSEKQNKTWVQIINQEMSTIIKQNEDTPQESRKALCFYLLNQYKTVKDQYELSVKEENARSLCGSYFFYRPVETDSRGDHVWAPNSA
ncbi:MAG: hypothetical protein V4496_02315 [Pseudomonadota bacterium]